MGTTTSRIHKPQTRVIAALVAGMLAVMVGLSLGVGQAWAGAQPGTPTLDNLLKKTYTISFKSSEPVTQSYAYSKSPTTKISDAKSSNTAVATVKVSHYKIEKKTHYFMIVTIKKPGTTNISFKLGSKKHTVKYVVKPYKNYLKSFKVGSKDYKAKFNPSAVDQAERIVAAGVSAKKITGKVQVKLKSGWKIKKIWYWTQSGDDWNIHFIKNGGTAKKATNLYVWGQKGTHGQVFMLYADQDL